MSSRSDAERMLEKAKDFYRFSGKRIAFAEFTNCNGAFVSGEIYVYVLDCKGVMLAHGINERFVGEDFIGQKDLEGRLFIRDIVDTANAEGSGWTEYTWFEPISRKWLPKVVRFERVDDIIICSGYYLHDEAWLPAAGSEACEKQETASTL